MQHCCSGCCESINITQRTLRPVDSTLLKYALRQTTRSDCFLLNIWMPLDVNGSLQAVLTVVPVGQSAWSTRSGAWCLGEAIREQEINDLRLPCICICSQNCGLQSRQHQQAGDSSPHGCCCCDVEQLWRLQTTKQHFELCLLEFIQLQPLFQDRQCCKVFSHFVRPSEQHTDSENDQGYI